MKHARIEHDGQVLDATVDGDTVRAARRDAGHRRGPAMAVTGDSRQDPRDPPHLPLAGRGVSDGAAPHDAVLLRQAPVVALGPPGSRRASRRLPLSQLRGRGRGGHRPALPRRLARCRPGLRGRLHGGQRLGDSRFPPRRPGLDAARQGPGRLLPPGSGARRRRGRRSRRISPCAPTSTASSPRRATPGPISCSPSPIRSPTSLG